MRRHRGCPHGIAAPLQAQTLDQLQPCQCARISDLVGEEAFRSRLRDLGMREGEMVTMVKQAPLADPVEYCVQGMHLSLRRAEARWVRIADVGWLPAGRPGRCFWHRWRRHAGRPD
ncbi:MAG: FeoA family protein [Candidatus Eisenbacteria bacterium]